MVNELQPENTKQHIGEASRAKPDPSIFHDLWQAAKYSAVQQSYDGIAQLANHLGAHLTEKKLVDRPDEPTSKANWLAQEVGYGLGKVPALAALYVATREGAARIGESTAASISLTSRTELSAAQFAFTGGLYDGITTKSREDHFWTDRVNATAIGGATLYTMGRTQLALQGASGMIEREATSGALAMLNRKAENVTFGLAAGAVGGFVNAETRALLVDHRPATGDELKGSITTSAAFGGGMSAILGAPTEYKSFKLGKRAGMPEPPPPGFEEPATKTSEKIEIPRLD